MAISVRIPAPFQGLTGGRAAVEAEGATLGALIDSLEQAHPGFKERLCDPAGGVRKFVNIFVNEDDVRFLKGLDTPLKPGDEVWIIPPLAGG